MKIIVDSDSGPYATYRRDVYGENGAIEVPDEVYERYKVAEAELSVAQDALDEAISAARELDGL